MGCGVFDADFFPVGIEFLGNDHGRGRHAALAHFGARVADDNGVVGFDFDPDIELWGVGRAGPLGHKKSQRQTRCRTAGDFEEMATVHAGVQAEFVHARAPLLATAWMAVRMRA